MFSHEEKMKALELLPKFEGSYSDVILALGYPSRSALINWHKEYLTYGHITKVHKRKKMFSTEQKQVAITHYLETGRNISRTTRMLGYPSRETLRTWILDVSPPIRQQVQSRVNWTKEQKKKGVLQLLTRVESAENVAEKLGMTRTSLYQWKEQFLGKGKKDNVMMQESNQSPEKLRQEINVLQKEVLQLQMEKAILEKTAELIKKGQGINPNLLTNKEKTIVIDALRESFPLIKLREAFCLAKSSYSYHHKNNNRIEKYAEVRHIILDIFKSNYSCFGYRRVHKSLVNMGVVLSEKVVRRLMAEEKLVIKYANKKGYSSYQGEISPDVPNLIKRDFKSGKPNEKWLTDITEFKIPAGKVYLSPIVDCFDGLVTSWSIGTSPNAELVNSMLVTAMQSLKEEENPLIHSDRGAHYRWPAWIELMASRKLSRSMSKKGCSPDNSACEGFFGRLKNECFYNHDWTSVTLEELIVYLSNYIQWYNEKRIKLSLGGLSPVDYRRSIGLTT